MRVLILILCLVALVGCEREQRKPTVRKVEASVLQERRGLAYVPNETEPYTGNVIEFLPSRYPKGEPYLFSDINYVDG